MKKIFLCLLAICLILTGCKSRNEKEVLNEFKNIVDNTKSYYLDGDMELINNEDVYSYKISVSYKEGDFYRIELKNKINNHEQLILRNNEGVYIVTPSLNKSFKFQSDWPYNNSQVYLLTSLLDDIENDPDKTFEVSDNEYIFTSNVNYPNNENLIKQKVYFGKDYLPTKVEVLDKDNNVQIKMQFNKIDLKTEFNDTYFDLNAVLNTEEVKNDDKKEETNNNETIVEENQEPGSETTDEQTETNEKTKKTATIDDIIYPMYLPAGTRLTNEQRVNTENGERLILTFSGDSSFTLVEETALYSNPAEIIPTTGSVELIGSSIAVINDNGANWFDNNIEYSVYSDTMSKKDLMQVIRSISVLPVSK